MKIYNPFKSLLNGTKKQDNNLETFDVDDLMDALKKHPNNEEVRNQMQKAFKKDPAGVLASLVRYQHSMWKKDVADWLSARELALDVNYPRRIELVEFYTDIEQDAFIYGIVHNKRILKVSNKKFRIANKKTKKENEELTDLLQTKWFNDFVKYAMQSKFHGYSLVYFSDWNEGRIAGTKLVYREHVKPETNMILKNADDERGVIYTDAPYSNYCIGIGNADDLGLYEKAAILYILKKHSWGNWDEFEERFGIPLLWAKTASNDTKVKGAIEKWLKELGSAGYGIFPADADLNMTEAKTSDAFQVFNEKRKAANEELEILLTGQRRVTSENGTYGKEKATLEEAEELTTDDKTFITHLVNNHLLPLLKINGYPVQDGDMLEWDETKQLTPTEQLAIYTGLNTMGFELDSKEIEERLGVKILGKKEDVANGEKANGDDEKKKKNKAAAPANKYDEFIEMHLKINELYNDVH